MIVNLRQLREDRGESLDDVAEATGVPKSTIGRAELGAVPRRPSARLALAKHFGLKPSEVWPAPRAAEVEEVATA